ncbi:helix-turn-helix transcriptional regulator [Bacillus cereus group sp. TH228LC]|uniref:helix-turn-helix transcriptional regulator n=1 Tax=Bacillus cereus group sp. TH228LC TaxID=3018049 RepID=UPI0022E71F84|nr:helix-turn-helix transcriptional regulator [Bacillus cereus group sp. TH228LC]MDA1577577.1 helix-turn-helix transcriptional regulator [Bacillus cereus group sp. TH228LC]
MKIDGKLVRLIRFDERLTQEAFAKTLGVGLTTIANVETEYRPVSDSLKVKLIRTFNLTDARLEDSGINNGTNFVCESYTS